MSEQHMVFFGRGDYEVPVSKVKVQKQKDNYVIEETRSALYKVVNQMKDKDFATIKHHVRRCYPFGERKGRKYKIWNREVHAILKALNEGTFRFSDETSST